MTEENPEKELRELVDEHPELVETLSPLEKQVVRSVTGEDFSSGGTE